MICFCLGSDGNLVNKILDPARLSKVETIFGNLIFRKPFINTVLGRLLGLEKLAGHSTVVVVMFLTHL
jgi:hypothetical protein